MSAIRAAQEDGMRPPDYGGGSLLNLLSSIIHAHEGVSPHPQATLVPAAQLARHEKLLYLVVDGVGEKQLSEFLATGRGRSFFAAHPRQGLTSVYPATTAAAITTLSTGASPTEHGSLGWHVHLPDLGIVSSILPLQTRTDMPLVGADFNLRAYLAIPSHLNTTRRRRVCLSYGNIATSRYSKAATQWHDTGSYTRLSGMVEAAAALARRDGPLLGYIYWPEYDTSCHEFGTPHVKTQAHLAAIDLALAQLVEQLAGTSTLLIVTADHGLVDTPVHLRVDLSRLEGFYDCLSTVPSGDSRSVHCFIRPRREQQFLNLVKDRLTELCLCLSAEDLLESGLFGPGVEHPALRRRLGDYVLLARGDAAFSAPIWGQDGACFIGNHGGMSATEMNVPLYLLTP